MSAAKKICLFAIVGNLGSILLVRKFKSAMCAVERLPVYSINAREFVLGINWFDHYSFWKFGYPSIMITDTALYRNRDYHVPEDTADKLDYARMAIAIQ